MYNMAESVRERTGGLDDGHPTCYGCGKKPRLYPEIYCYDCDVKEKKTGNTQCMNKECGTYVKGYYYSCPVCLTQEVCYPLFVMRF